MRLDALLLGDLGNPRVDARLLQAVLLRNGQVADWLRSRDIDADAIERAFPATGWE